MATVDKHELLFSTDLKYFKALQLIGGKSIFDRYKIAKNNIIEKYIDEKYRNFLAYPVKESDKIEFHGIKARIDDPQILAELQGNDAAKYQNLKTETLQHYQGKIDELKNAGKTTEAEFLTDAIKSVDDRFVFCYDDIIVLGAWGMQMRENVREDITEIRKKAPRKPKEPKQQPIPEPEPPIIDEPQPKPEEPPVNPFTVRFNAGENGTLNGTSEYSKFAGDTVHSNEIPEVQPKGGYEFVDWDKNPNDYRITDDTEFTAQYREIPQVVSIDTDKESWWSRFWGAGKGCLNWLLLLLLLALIFMVIWCCLLKKCNFNFCGCDCEETTVVVPKSTVSPCNAQVKSGGDEGYVGLFEMGQPSGSFVFEYNTQNVPDKITVYDGADTSGKIIFTYEGSTGTTRKAFVNFNKPTITVEIIGLGTQTYWEFLINCP